MEPNSDRQQAKKLCCKRLGVAVVCLTILFGLFATMGKVDCTLEQSGKFACQFGILSPSINSASSPYSAVEVVDEVVDEADSIETVGDHFIHRFVAFNDSHETDKFEWIASNRRGWYFQFEFFAIPHMPAEKLEKAVKEELKARSSRFNIYNYQRQCHPSNNNRQNDNVQIAKVDCQELHEVIDNATATLYADWTSPTYTQSVWGIQCVLFEDPHDEDNYYRTCSYSFFHEYPTKDVAQLPLPQLIKPLLNGGRQIGTSLPLSSLPFS